MKLIHIINFLLPLGASILWASGNLDAWTSRVIVINFAVLAGMQLNEIFRKLGENLRQRKTDEPVTQA